MNLQTSNFTSFHVGCSNLKWQPKFPQLAYNPSEYNVF